MLNRSNAWVASGTTALLVVLVTEWAGAAADPAVQGVADEVSETYYRTYHLDVENMGLGLYGGAGYDMGGRNRRGWPAPGSLGNQEARLYLQHTFADMGLSVSVQGSYLNVVGELSGTTTPENIYIIGGHYDTVGRDSRDRPGGDDNASGTAGVLEASRVLSQYQFESTIRFIGFNAEEDGVAGSEHYVNSRVIPSGENIVGMVNLDTILRPGWADDPQAIIDADLSTDTTDVGSVTWAQAYQQAAADYVPSLTVDATIYMAHNSDHARFVSAGYPAFLVAENWCVWPMPCPNEYYHTSEDASDRLANDPNSPSGVTYDFAFATDVTRAAVALIAQEAVLVPEPCQVPLQAGDANMDYEFNQLDLVQVQIAGKYLSGQAATWGEGDWNGAPGGYQGNSPQGDGLFNQLDIVAAQQAAIYRTGVYAGLQGEGLVGAVPEPSTLMLAVLGLLAFIAASRRR